jgi:glutathione S-transferase
MSTPTLVLYRDAFWISPYVFSCFVSLREKELVFDTKPVALQNKATQRPDYAGRTITARVPALEHKVGEEDAFTLAESSAIVEYLDETFTFPKHMRLLPAATRDRARARQLMSWLRSDDTAALREDRPTTSMFYERTSKPLSEAGERAAKKLVEVAERALAKGAPYLFAHWCIADSELAFMLHRLILNGDAVPGRVRDYAEAQWQRAPVREFVEMKRDPYVPYG